MKEKSNKQIVLLLIVAILLIGIVIIGYIYYRPIKEENNNTNITEEQNLLTYKSDFGNFSFKYPEKDWEIDDNLLVQLRLLPKDKEEIIDENNYFSYINITIDQSYEENQPICHSIEECAKNYTDRFYQKKPHFEEYIKIDGQRALKQIIKDSSNNNDILIHFIYNKKLYRLWLNARPEKFNDYQQDFNTLVKTWFFYNQESELKCSNDSDCINTCCGCLHKDSKECDKECDALVTRNCICINGSCEEIKEKEYNCQEQEQEILDLIDKENYCEVKEDCRIISKIDCPFGCYWLVNKNSELLLDDLEPTEIEKKIQEYHEICPICAPDCFVGISIEYVECINNKCQYIPNTVY
ncbi:MAG: PsbP-related protein [Patescibacteria group bacterium]|nr:PsbP-related protein [Patescibacteria group bacterium]